MPKPIAMQTSAPRPHDAAVDAIIEALSGLRYGQLEIHLHDGQVVKLMRTEKIRVYEEGGAKPHSADAG